MTDGSTLPLDLEGWTCPLPLRDYPTIVMGHGSGGKLMADLKVVAEHRGLVTARTGIGGTRVVDVPAGELLPRIC